jgi:ABC-type multidrug transport system fused ATPase/permease subunit
MAFFDRAITGQLVSRITNDTESIRQLYVQVLFEMLQGLTVLLGALIAMAWLDWRLMLIVLLLVPAVVLIVFGYQRLSSAAVARSRELRSDINAQMAESIAGMSVLQATGSAVLFGARFGATNEAHYTARLGELRANAWLLRPALDLVNVLLIVAVIAAAGSRPLETVEIGLLYAFVSYIARVVDPLIQITMQFSVLQQSMIAAARVNTLLHEGATPAVARARRISRGAVELRDLSFGYDPAEPVANRRCSRCCCVSTRRRPDASRSTGCRWHRSATTSSAPTSGWSLRSRSCWRPAHATTSTWAEDWARTRSRPQRGRRARMNSFSRSSRATRRRSAKAARDFHRDRSSLSRWRARWPASRACSSSTKRRRVSTARPSSAYRQRSPSCAAASR